MNITELHQLPRTEKLSIIEALWDDLVSEGEAHIALPAWHFEELKKTEGRLRNGTEEILDWQDAKAELVPAEHKRIIDERLEQYRSGQSKPVPHAEMMKRLQRK